MLDGKEPVSLNDLRPRVKDEHLELSCVTTIPVRIVVRHTFGEREPGYDISLELPPTPQRDNPFIGDPDINGGDPQLICTLEYPSSTWWPLKLDDMVRALNIDPDAKIWTAGKDLVYEESKP